MRHSRSTGRRASQPPSPRCAAPDRQRRRVGAVRRQARSGAAGKCAWPVSSRPSIRRLAVELLQACTAPGSRRRTARAWTRRRWGAVLPRHARRPPAGAPPAPPPPERRRRWQRTPVDRRRGRDARSDRTGAGGSRGSAPRPPSRWAFRRPELPPPPARRAPREARTPRPRRRRPRSSAPRTPGSSGSQPGPLPRPGARGGSAPRRGTGGRSRRRPTGPSAANPSAGTSASRRGAAPPRPGRGWLARAGSTRGPW